MFFLSCGERMLPWRLMLCIFVVVSMYQYSVVARRRRDQHAAFFLLRVSAVLPGIRCGASSTSKQ